MIAAASLLSTPGAITASLSPAIIAALVSRHNMTTAAASLLGVAELVGMTVALLASPFVVNRYDRRITAATAVGLAIAAQLLSLAVADPVLLAALRALAGGGAGLAFALAVACLAATPRPDRSFGISAATNQLAATLVFVSVPLLASSQGPSASILAFVLFLILAGVLAPLLPRGPAQHQRAAATVSAKAIDRRAAAAGFAAVFLLSAGFGTVWPVIFQLGAMRGVEAATIAHGFAGVGFAGIAAGATAAIVGDRFGNRPLLLIGSAGLATAMPVLLLPDLPFVIAMLTFMFFWVIAMPYYFGAVAKIDHTGRLAALISAMIPSGVAFGQATGTLVEVRLGVSVLVWIGAGLVLCACVAILRVFSKADAASTIPNF